MTSSARLGKRYPARGGSLDERSTTGLARPGTAHDADRVDQSPTVRRERDLVIESMPEPRSERSATLSVPVRVLDARTLKRLDDHREPRATRWDYDVLFESVD
jgi:hypothetical protein